MKATSSSKIFVPVYQFTRGCHTPSVSRSSVECRSGFCEKSWNKKWNIVLQISRKISRVVMSRDWQRWSNLSALPTADFVLVRSYWKVTFSCTTSVLGLYCFGDVSAELKEEFPLLTSADVWTISYVGVPRDMKNYFRYTSIDSMYVA
jgi:hypothetical protein